MLNPEEQDDPYLVFLRCTYTALNDALDANVYTSILAAVIGDIKEPLINARILPLTLEWMRTYLLLRRRGTAKRWKRCGRAGDCAGNHYSRRNTSSAIATLGDATGIPR